MNPSFSEKDKAVLNTAIDDLRHRHDRVIADDDSINVFLEQTASCDIPRGERLRHLAIDLQHDDFAEGWQGLRRIYLAAVREAPDDVAVLHSWAVAAGSWLEEWKTPDLQARRAIAADGREALSQAIRLDPHSSDLFHSLGLLYYNELADEDARHELLCAALDWFTRAVMLDSHNEMARLYRAHCLHDLHDWSQALTAYLEVDQQRLLDEWPRWRTYKLREQIAYCFARSGQHRESIDRFNDLLNELELLDQEIFDDAVVNFDELVDAVTSHLNDPAVLHRVQKLVARTGWANRYENLRSEFT